MRGFERKRRKKFILSYLSVTRLIEPVLLEFNSNLDPMGLKIAGDLSQNFFTGLGYEKSLKVFV